MFGCDINFKKNFDRKIHLHNLLESIEESSLILNFQEITVPFKFCVKMFLICSNILVFGPVEMSL